LAWSCDSGDAARAAGELGEAPAGVIRTEAPTDEKKKRRLTTIPFDDILPDILAILSDVRQKANYLGVYCFAKFSPQPP
jgi:hypothetical protein